MAWSAGPNGSAEFLIAAARITTRSGLLLESEARRQLSAHRRGRALPAPAGPSSNAVRLMATSAEARFPGTLVSPIPSFARHPALLSGENEDGGPTPEEFHGTSTIP